MDSQIKELIKEAIKRLIENTISKKKVESTINRHRNKLHFIPIRYRILGGLLQSLNIQFGNYIEELIHLIVENEKGLNIYNDISGKKNIKIEISSDTDTLIDSYITKCQTSYNSEELSKNFKILINNILQNENNNNIENKILTTHDIDVLFKDNKTSVFYYVEVKYNDDHDTGKFVDINRKFIKTYAGLIKLLNIKTEQELKPILFFLNNKIMKGNIYIPEKTHIYRGSRLFDEFFSVSYSELDEYMHKIGNDVEIINLFDDLYKKIRYNLTIE